MTRFFYLLFLVTFINVPSMAQANMVEEVASEQEATQPKLAAANIPNDVNNDGVVDVWDVVDIVKYVNGSMRSEFKVEKADINNDGTVNLDDATLLSKIIVGEELPAGNENPQGNNDDDGVMRGDSVVDPVGPAN